MRLACRFLSLVLGVSCVSTGFAEEKLGDRKNPIKFAMVPSSDANKILANMTPAARCLEKESGYFFDISVPNSYIVVMEGFGTRKVDVAMLATFGYVYAHTKYGAEALLKVTREGDGFYKSQIIVHADSKIKTVEDLKGKKFAFVDPASTSGTILPKKYLKEKNVKLGEQVYAGKHDVVVTMVYQKQVDAGATYYNSPGKDSQIRDARARVLTQFPDVEQKVKILTTTNDIPNDPIVIRKDLAPEMKAKLKKAFLTCIKSNVETFKAINNADGFVEANDKEYAGVLEMVKDSGIDLERELQPKKESKK